MWLAEPPPFSRLFLETRQTSYLKQPSMERFPAAPSLAQRSAARDAFHRIAQSALPLPPGPEGSNARE